MKPAHPVLIYVVEDNDWYNRLLVHTLSLNPDNVVKSFFTARDFFENLSEVPDIVTLDYRLPDATGTDVLKGLKQEYPDVEVILISEQDDINTVVELLKLGAKDYIIKSDDIRDRLLNTVQNITKEIGLRSEISMLRKEVQKKYDFRKSILGESPKMQIVYERIEKALNTSINVSVYGETGTGKELVAKAIHYNSKRKERSFVAFNVSAVPSELMESELFGHEKGAFTGASYRRTGKFEEADGGTLFLDEIAEMDPALQVKLLRALQEKEIVRVGSNQTIKTDCRIIVATNKNLKEEVKKGRFREDLYYRLLGLPIELPPLRDRGNDILLLARHFIEAFCKENQLTLRKLSQGAQKKLISYSYPGNIRELKSIIELAITLSDKNEIQPQDIILDSDAQSEASENKELTLRDYELKIIKSYLNKYNNDIRTVAQKLDIGVSTIYRLMKEINS
ncbi:MAG TPA: sigma-54 dependent transcriptional regulator [Bacteroidales bacterium]|jgi:DNA-binding NtrC family response regulator|nr:sigma-54 dependent transcriptional regulator [Bacteroidales bacterium]